MSLREYIAALKASRPLGLEIVHHRHLPASPAVFADERGEPESPARAVYAQAGIKRLYRHQKEGVDLIRRGRHTVIATPTASGKSLVYNLPVLETLTQNPGARALYLFPLKALARDQLEAAGRLLDGLNRRVKPETPLSAGVYDGDLSNYAKAKVRKNPPHILLTNPEMLHLAMLPHHHLWEAFFAGLTHVVVDEVHTYRGVMGSHMAWVFRRLLRICRLYGSSPVFVFCSATIANPKELCESLTGLSVAVVSGGPATPDGASGPSGEKDILLMNGLSGAAQTAIQLMHAAVHRKLRTIVYTQSRKITELIALWTSQRAGALADRITAYRAGFLPEERRQIEERLADGDLLAVVSTSALELGIDIGNLDLCILVGYPGTIMSTWQRAGRVGRGGSPSAMILVAHEDALDHYFVRHPTELFDMPPEHAVINPWNPVIMERHLECAAADLKLSADEPWLAEKPVKNALASLEDAVRLLQSHDGRFWYASRKAPHREVSLRGTGQSIPIFVAGQKSILGEVDRFRAFYETHEGAVYLHHGNTYVVTKFDYDHGVVEAESRDVVYYTRARSEKSTEILEVHETRRVWNTEVGFGRLKVTDQVTGYEMKSVRGQRTLGIVGLDLPPNTYETEGLWIVVPDAVRDDLEARQMHFMGGIHAVEHAAIGILPLLVMTDRNDLGGISTPYHPQTGTAAVFVYDGTPGGIGLSRQAFQRARTLLERTLETIVRCQCDTGCPGCVHSPKCGSGNRPIDKDAAREVLTGIQSRGQLSGISPDYSSGPGTRRAPVRRNTENPLPGPSRFAVLDIETRRSASEVGGWMRADRMGISCAVLYDSGTDTFHHYLQDDVSRLEQDLDAVDLVIGFNILRFDYKVLSGVSARDFSRLPTLDLLQKVHDRLGYRLTLDNLASATLETPKSADGLQALAWWKTGEIDKIIDYCRQDVRVTRDLYRFGREHGYVLFTNKAKQKVRLPVRW